MRENVSDVLCNLQVEVVRMMEKPSIRNDSAIINSIKDFNEKNYVIEMLIFLSNIKTKWSLYLCGLIKQIVDVYNVKVPSHKVLHPTTYTNLYKLGVISPINSGEYKLYNAILEGRLMNNQSNLQLGVFETVSDDSTTYDDVLRHGFAVGSIGYLIKYDMYDEFVRFTSDNPFFDLNTVLPCFDLYFYDVLSEKSSIGLTLTQLALFYGSVNIYEYLKSLGFSAGDLTLEMSIVGNIPLIDWNWKDSVGPMSKLIVFSHSYNFFDHVEYTEENACKSYNYHNYYIFNKIFDSIYNNSELSINTVVTMHKFIRDIGIYWRFDRAIEDRSKEFCHYNVVRFGEKNRTFENHMLQVLGIMITNFQCVSFYKLFYHINFLREVKFPKTFNTIHVNDCSYMFFKCINLKRIFFSNSFRTNNVVTMSSMFSKCSSIEKILLPKGFNTRNCVLMDRMFSYCENLRFLDLSNGFNTCNVTCMKEMFSHCSNLTEIRFRRAFNTSKVNDMSYMFYNCSKLRRLDIVDSFDTSSVVNMRGMFQGCSSLESINIMSFDTSNVIDMANMFRKCSNLTHIKFPKTFYTSKVVNMNSMFRNCHSLKKIIFPKCFNTSSVQDISFFLKGCSELSDVVFSESFALPSCLCMESMFWNCSNLQTVRFPEKLNTSSVQSMKGLFSGCCMLESVYFPRSFNLSNVTTMENFLKKCRRITSVDLSHCPVGPKAVIISCMFKGCENLRTVVLPPFPSIQRSTIQSFVFYGCGELRNIKMSRHTLRSICLDSSLQGCKNLSGIKVYPELDVSRFNGCYQTCKMYSSVIKGILIVHLILLILFCFLFNVNN